VSGAGEYAADGVDLKKNCYGGSSSGMERPMPTFAFDRADYETIPCNLCGGTENETLATRDRNGLRVRTCICSGCGLIFINPRMTQNWYDRYYKEEYRAQMARFRGREVEAKDEEKLFAESTRHGEGLVNRFDSLWLKGITLEVGSSVGGVLHGIARKLGVEVVGIEPSTSETDFANRKGIKSYCDLIERFERPLPPVANVVCTQSLNHFLNPKFFFQFAHRILQPGGRLVLEVANFRQMFRQWGWLPRAVQIDHTYMFVPEVLEAFTKSAGFEVLRMERDEDKSAAELKKNKEQGLPRLHTRLIAKKLEMEPFSRVQVLGLSRRVRESFDRLPNSKLGYFWKHGFKAWRRKILGRK
jgi:SAM-dependent methyltransferase